MTTPDFVSRKLSRTATIHLKGPLAEVFPLFGPIREKEWAAGWDPEIIYSSTGLVEEHMVFRTPSHHGHHEPDPIWTVSKYQPEGGLIEYMVFTTERLWWITVECEADLENQATKAEITYTYVGLTELGNMINQRALQVMFANDLQDWQDAINHYLATGEMLQER